MRKSAYFAFCAAVLVAVGMVLLALDQQGIWSVASVVAGLVCGGTAVVFRELGR